MLVSSHPMGNANVRQAMLAFAEAGMLECFLTSLAIFDGSLLGFLSKQRGFRELRRRQFPEALRPFTRCHPAREILRLVMLRSGYEKWIQHESGWASVDQIFQSLDRNLAFEASRRHPSAVYCYEDGALHSFQAAKPLGARCFYDYPVAHWRKVRSLMEEECHLQPEWINTMPGFKDSQEKLDRKDEELRLADQIIVASEFSRASLSMCPFPLAPIFVNRYGAPTALLENRRLPLKLNNSSPIKVLFVGGLHQMKGISYLLDAMKLLGNRGSLTLIGALPTRDCRPLNAALSSNQWIPSLAHDDILTQMSSHDVFAFPSLSEGFGMVITEALSQGLPVITTPNTCGPDVLSDGEDGFIVPIRSPVALAEKLELLHRDRDLLATMSEASQAKARQLSWASYRNRLVAEVKRNLSA